MLDLAVITWALGQIRDRQQQRRHVSVLVHQGVFLGSVGTNESIPVTGSGAFYVAPLSTSEPTGASAVPESAFPGPLFYFVKVTNLGRRDVSITHVWVDGNPPGGGDAAPAATAGPAAPR